MSWSEARQILIRSGAILHGHFRLTSGRHSDTYVNKDAVFPNTRDVNRLCELIAMHFLSVSPEVVVGPVAGGVGLSQWTAHHLSTLSAFPALSVYADKTDDDDFELRRGYDRIVSGKRVLVVEDVLTTGGSVRKVVEVVRRSGGHVVGIGALCNRGKVTKSDVGDVPIYALTKVEADSWAPADCALCAQGVPINTNVGKGKVVAAQAAT